MKRIKRKRLKEDEFVSTMAKVVNYAKGHTREITAVASALLVIVAVLIVVRWVQARTASRHSRLLGEILEISAQLKENPGRLAELEKLAGEGKYSRMAYIKLAAYHIEKGETEKARDYLGKIPAREKDLLYYQSRDMLAQILVTEGAYDQAIEIYKKIEEEKPEDFALDIALFHEAQAYEKKGDDEEALVLYRRIQEEYAQTYFGLEAAQKVGELEKKIK